MKMKIGVALFGALLLAVGCVHTVSERTTFGVPGLKDSVEGRYERSPEELLRASKEVISTLGVLDKESNIYNETNQVKTVEGKVNQRSVYVRIQRLDPKWTMIAVQTRTRGGGTDIDLAHEIEKEVALKLVH